jgi:hypothetical protein
VSRDPGLDRWRRLECHVDAMGVVGRQAERDLRGVVLDFLAEAVCQTTATK